MILPPFELHRPRSLGEAVELAARLGTDFDFIAGGTDLLQNYKNRIHPKPHLISLMHIPGMTEITPSRIGALARLADIERCAELKEKLPGFVEAASKVATPLVRESATLGGNLLVETRCYYLNQSEFWRASKGSCLKAEGHQCLVVPQEKTCYATFSSDVAPMLVALDAEIELAGPGGSRRIPLAGLYQGDGIERTIKRRDEIIVAVHLPAAASSFRSAYRKLRIRDSFDYPDLGVAIAARVSGSSLAELKVVLTAVGTVPQDLSAALADFCGKPVDGTLLREIAKRARESSKPVKNVSMSPTYRKQMVEVFVRRMLEELVAPVEPRQLN